MKSAKLYAYLVDNLGDDLMVDILLKRFPQCRFYSDVWVSLDNSLIENRNYFCTEKIYRRYGRISHLLSIITLGRSDKFFFPRIFKKFEEKCAVAVYIGGSLFMQDPSENVKERIENEEKRITISPRYIIGANFGPYQTEEFLNGYAQYFSKCAGITFRDKYSYSLFSDNDGVAYAPDVVLNLDVSPYIHREQTRNVIISVVDFYRKSAISQYASSYEQYIAECCVKIIQRGDIPVLMSFCRAEGDEDAVQRILNNIAPQIRSYVKKYYYRGNIPDALDRIAEAKYVIATRFHSMILALCFQKPFFCIAYNSKIINVLHDLNCNAWLHPWELENHDPLEMMEQYKVPVDACEYIKKAEKQFAQFEEVLKS